MATDDPGWAWFDGPRPADPAVAEAAERELALAFARCFRGAEGTRVLDHLRARTVNRVLGPDAPDTYLRHLEGQRQMVAAIVALVDRGRDGGPMT